MVPPLDQPPGAGGGEHGGAGRAPRPHRRGGTRHRGAARAQVQYSTLQYIIVGLIANLLYRQSQGHQFFNFRKFGAKKHLVFLFSTKMFQYMAGLKDL